MNTNGQFVIVRTRGMGVNTGYLEEFDRTTRTAVVRDCRQIWSWTKGANTLMEIANGGLPDEGCRISEPAKGLITITDVCGIYECTSKAEENLSRSRWAK